jgi:hypothetical protein
VSGHHVLARLAVPALALFLTSCGSTGSRHPYAVSATIACLKKRPEYVSASGLMSATRLAFNVPPAEFLRTAAAPRGAPLEVRPPEAARSVPAGTWRVGVIFRNPSTFDLDDATVYLSPNERAALHLYESERRHINAYGKTMHYRFHLDRLLQHSRNVTIVWGRDDDPSSWRTILLSCLRT